jgi:hypothetical protein
MGEEGEYGTLRADLFCGVDGYAEAVLENCGTWRRE